MIPLATVVIGQVGFVLLEDGSLIVRLVCNLEGQAKALARAAIQRARTDSRT